MKNNRTVRIAWTNKTATFTQRGLKKNRGFIRLNGVTISGEMNEQGVENIFYTDSDGLNNNVPYEGDSARW